MKKIAGLFLLIMFLIPVISTVSAEEINIQAPKIDQIDITNCISPFIGNNIFLKENNNSIKYTNFTIELEYIGDEYCEVTLNGTIETDIGTVTFKDFTFKIDGEDCVETAIAILKSLTENQSEPKES